ncbi:glycosyl hydrolase [Proteiniphilum sp. UBA5480]|jgi:hypothetical protein|uniref:glycosyl hydrolase n=1 Tax=Proteiniphilum sp. UBA5480 TaxID=1947282 RepID=UPI000E9C22DB|nr:glycosyl hydrolase [Proteiniphilum sp. UBA5480]HBG58190.1 hypothetical protein [Porphyromonadaceae bacterium]
MRYFIKINLAFFFLFIGFNVHADSISERTWDHIATQFKELPLKFRPNPLWFWNDTKIEEEELIKQIKSFKVSGYGGLSILPFGPNFSPKYLTSEYLDYYKTCVKEAEKQGMTMWLYDEYGFPSGSGGLHNADGISRFGLQHPDHVIKRLDMIEHTPHDKTIDLEIPPGIFMASVAMDTINFRRIDLSPYIQDNRIQWKLPEGSWKIMFFVCKNDEAIVDYLDPEAAKLFVDMTHERYAESMGDYFGATIRGTFFDEPTLYRASGRSWTALFNDKFEEKYGFSPSLYYPALWYDIGDETVEARNYLFGFRAELYAEGYTKVVGEWSRRHGLRATGHQDNEEMINPVGISGDLMKSFKYLDIPGIDKIGGNRPAEHFYKIVSSAAYNWDHSMVMSETYGAMGNLDWDDIYSIAMDQYAKGINLLIPHAVWYDTSNVVFEPELSSRNPLYADRLLEFNNYLTRLNVLLQNEGRWVGDIAVLYPIETMQGEHYMDGPLGYYQGGVKIPGMDYVDVGIHLFDSLGYDFMYLHPEVLDNQCTVQNEKLVLNNETQFNRFSILVVPGVKTISLSNLQKIHAFIKNGGSVIFTSRLPEKGTKKEDDQAVKNMMADIFRFNSQTKSYGSLSNSMQGKAFFVPKDKIKNIGDALIDTDIDFQLQFTGSHQAKSIHKHVFNKNIWFIINPEKKPIDLVIKINGHFDFELWDPHTGETSRPGNINHKQGITFVQIALEANRSLFLVEKQ